MANTVDEGLKMNSTGQSGTTRRVSRRHLLAGAAGAVATAGLAGRAPVGEARRWRGQRGVVRGRIRQAVAAWCFDPMPLDTLVRNAAALGIQSGELVDPEEWPTLKKD